MQYAFMIAGLIGVLLSARCRAKRLVLISTITFAASALIAFASGQSVGGAIELATALTSALLTAHYVIRILAPGIAKNEQQKTRQDRENFVRRVRMLGIYVGDLGAAEPGSPEELIHMGLGPLPDLDRLEAGRDAGIQTVRKDQGRLIIPVTSRCTAGEGAS